MGRCHTASEILRRWLLGCLRRALTSSTDLSQVKAGKLADWLGHGLLAVAPREAVTGREAVRPGRRSQIVAHVSAASSESPRTASCDVTLGYGPGSTSDPIGHMRG